MHPSVVDFLERVLKKDDISGKSVLEVGSYDVNGTPRSVVIPMKPASYIGVDSQAGPGVDQVVDVDSLVQEFGVNKFDVVISTEMLEHALDWRGAIFQMKLVVKPGGLLVLTTRSPGFPYHPYPGDYWRFTGQHLREAFSDMELLAIEPDVFTHPGVLLKARRIPGRTLLTVDELANVEPFPPE